MENVEKKEKAKIEISLATPEDVRGIREVQYKVHLAIYPNKEAGITAEDYHDLWKDRFTDEKIKEYIEKELNKPNRTTLVAKENSKIIGFCSFDKDEDKNKVTALYILPEYQGLGIGKRFWEKALQSFDLTKDISVEVVPYTRAVGFYEKLGFKDTGKRFNAPPGPMKSGHSLPLMEMVIKVNN